MNGVLQRKLNRTTGEEKIIELLLNVKEDYTSSQNPILPNFSILSLTRC